jgi:hypothetical protein
METISPLQGAEYLVRLDRRLSAIEARLVPLVVDTPYVGGTAEVGGTLNCTMGNWRGEPTSYAYQWKRDGTNVGDGTASYVVLAADGGHSITCVVTATNGAGSTAASPSNAVEIPAPVTAAAEAPVPAAAAHPRAASRS